MPPLAMIPGPSSPARARRIRTTARACASVLALSAAACGTDVVEPLVPDPTDLAIAPAGPDVVTAEVASSVVLSVRVVDAGGAGYPDHPVTWSVESGGGRIVSAATSPSDATGHAASVWVLGPVAGVQVASAVITDAAGTAKVEFVANAVPGPPSVGELASDSVLLSARGETVFLAPSYADAHGNVTAGDGVVWSSADTTVAIVAADGLVTGRGPGSTYVRASFSEPSDSILVTVVPRGAITVTFDDGWRTTYTEAYPLFDELGFVANVAVNPGTVTFSGFLDLDQLDALHDAGWSMVSHTMTHANLTTLSEAELDYELRESRAFLEAQGYLGADVFIVPYHDWTQLERNSVARHYRVARGVTANSFAPDSLVRWMPDNPYDLTGIEADSLPYTTVEGRDRLRGLLDRTVSEGAFLDLFFHQMPAESIPALRETLELLDEYRERVLPYHELYPKWARVVR